MELQSSWRHFDVDGHTLTSFSYDEQHKYI